MNTFFTPHIGTRVCWIDDDRHIGRIDRVYWSSRVDVTWLETGWKSLDVPVHELRKAYPKQWRE